MSIYSNTSQSIQGNYTKWWNQDVGHSPIHFITVQQFPILPFWVAALLAAMLAPTNVALSKLHRGHVMHKIGARTVADWVNSVEAAVNALAAQ